MIDYKELLILIGLVVLVLDLIITGFIGLIRKEIYQKSIGMSLLFLPLGFIGRIFGYLFGKIDNAPDRGNAAISSSIAIIAVGLLISIIFGFYYIDKYKIIKSETVETLVRFALITIIIAVPVLIAIQINRRKK